MPNVFDYGHGRRMLKKVRRRVLRKAGRKARRGVPMKLRNRNMISISKVVAGKNIANLNAASSAGSITANNQGFLSLATSSAQDTQYFAISYAFCLTDVPEYASYIALYDRYRISKIVFKLYTLNNVSATSVTFTNPSGSTIADYPVPTPGNGSVTGMMYWVVDYDDNNSVTTTDNGFDTFRNRKNVRMTPIVRASNAPFVRTFKPRVAIAAYDASSVFTGYANMKAGWCDTASPSDSILHYGLKLGFEVINSCPYVNYLNFKVEATYYVDFKDPI